ncbi:MAG: hypothetical protein C4527_05145 [Candidatus Omnitrophota bacterium]|jgi:hypothetical protein|nr:MAG: hypothetical protein C4527_05145 [Candidatus Omnitrophota bacterium]
MKDVIVEEIRRFRDAHAQKFNYNIDAICEDFMVHQKICGHTVVKLEPKKPANKTMVRMVKQS